MLPGSLVPGTKLKTGERSLIWGGGGRGLRLDVSNSWLMEGEGEGHAS